MAEDIFFQYHDLNIIEAKGSTLVRDRDQKKYEPFTERF